MDKTPLFAKISKSFAEILCDNLTAPDHGQFTPYYHDGSTPYGQNAMFSCNDGYVLDGPATLTCKGDGPKGYFEGQPPTCKGMYRRI